MSNIGAKWWKFDFHTHTPASGDYSRGQFDPEQITPRQWLEKYLEHGVQCVAVTDHNTTQWLGVLIDEAKNLREEGQIIHIFPGIEVTANGNIHILGIFDPSCSTEHVAGLIGAVKGTAGQIDIPCESSPIAVIEEIHRLGGLAIPAHVDLGAGAFGIDSWQTYTALIDSSDAVEIIFPERVGTWNDKRQRQFHYLANKPKVLGSDSHMPREVGKGFTWVKMGEPNIDGLKLALIDGCSSVKLGQDSSVNPNLIRSNKIIHSIKVDKFKYINQRNGLDISFSPWLNSIIGSRGSGKSSLVEYSRIVLGKEEQLNRNKDLIPEILSSFQSFKRLSKDRNDIGVLLENSSISCIYEKDNTKYKLNWKVGDHTEIFKIDCDGNEVAENGNISNRFPVSIYSQKQIFEMSKNPYFLVGVIDNEKDVNQYYDEILNKIVDLGKDFLELKQLDIKISKEKDIEGRLAEISNFLAQIENEQNKGIIENFKIYNDKNQIIVSYFIQTNELINDIRNLKDKGNFTSLNLILNQEENLEKAEQLNSKIDSLKQSLDQYLNDIEAISNDLKTDLSTSAFSTNAKNAEDAYKETISTLEQSGVSFDDHAKLLHEQSALLSNLSEINDHKQEREAIAEKIEAVYAEIILIRKNISLARQEFIQENFSNLSNVRVKLLPFGVMKESTFREVIEKKDNVFVSSIYDDEEEKGILFNLLKAIREQENLDSASDLIFGFKQSLLLEPLGQEILDNCEKRLIDHLYTMQKNEKFALNLLSWFPEDDLLIEFKTKNGNFQPIHKGSAGQKSATILSLLLSFGDEPLILDQPEDDLDNSLITDLIVEKVRERKIHRQIIIVTHNPNIVVNGDSENIISLDNKGVIQVSSHGALQTREVRSEVCKIMEGGIQALEKRYNRMIRLDQ
ncbi:TrlF family AAA-like ATPase [Acinetobacter parvus]|uniref:TrlF family AAA-like ATPase n=1 Tax=Acinetobacter parvus TaxID=134533 RepID=UPI00391BD4B5